MYLIINKLNNIAQSRWHWLLYLFGSLALIITALFYQYVLETLPCVLCIQIRLWFSLLVIIAFIGLITRHVKIANILANLSVTGIAVALTERSYQLLGTERGFVFGDCGFDPGLPSWLALDEWLPWLYRVETSCGYTPDIIFGITMAEMLMVLSVVLLIFSASLSVAAVFTSRNE